MTPRERIMVMCAKAAGHTGANFFDVIGRDRRQPAVRARALVYRQLRSEGWSFPKIGRHFKRDHTTIMGALRRRA